MKANRKNPGIGHPDYIPYDTSTLTFAESGASPARAQLIRAIEWVTGKITLLRIANEFEKGGRVYETTFWEKILDLLKIELQCTEEEIQRIPASGPVVMVANHPYGFVDGVALTSIVSRVRPDLKILTRAFFAKIPEIDAHMVPVAFPHDPDSTQKNIAVRKEVMEHLDQGGVVILFPAGRVATARKLFGEALEHDWNPFTSKMILKSRARVVPVYFSGQNGPMYQFVQHFSPTLRQSLMMHEITRLMGKPIRPVIGQPIEREEIDPWVLNPRGFMEHLRERTLQLRNQQK
ncbi:lysophospholipid acyltransferase family protein [Ostreiculturibacter nitratireducens]|uniref:lysophospholipid acyltransferase family protein n=1 Tax=Ostreiculturibacter nitratireducens TaxID=3075226 RepID=UPI0031B580E9